MYLIFNFFSDGSVTRAGWYIDDVFLRGPDDAPPAAPADLTAAPNPVTGIDLAWTPPGDPDVDLFRVYHSTASGGPYTLVTTLTRTTTTYTHVYAPAGVPSFYVVTAVDLWGNESPYSNEASATAPGGPAVIFWDDMEGQDPGWVTGGTPADLWQRGTPTSGPGYAFSGSNVWATNLSGNYPNNANAWLMTPEIDLTGHQHATLRFAHWYSLERNYDFGRVEVSSDGGQTWTELARYTSPASGGRPVGWEQPTVSLDAYAGQVIRLRFRLTSDGSVTYPGWYIDDVLVAGAPAPSNTLEPPSDEGEGAGQGKPRVEPPAPALRLKDLFAAVGGGGGGGRTAAIPVPATVTIVETGVTVRTDPATGEYTLRHPAGSWTAVAEAYGFYPAEARVTITRDGTTTHDFILEPIPRGTVTGTVTDRRTGQPVAGARVWVVEDPMVAPAYTGDDGSFRLTVLEGSYTLVVQHPAYHRAELQVTVPGGAEVPVAVELRPFIGVGAELAYDDGTAENAWAYYEAGNAWAVRFTVPEGKAAKLIGARFMFWDTSWPNPGGTDFLVEVYAADGPGGSPGTRLAGPIPATARRDGNWTDVDLSDLGVDVQGDFFIAYVQAGDYPNVPGLATDEDGPFYDRSWERVGGMWSKTPPDEGNRMIRAILAIEVTSPVITSPADETYTRDPELTVTGLAASGTTVTLYNNGVAVGTAEAAGGTFSIPVSLQPGENVLTATATAPGGTTDPSQPVRVYLDQVAPELTVEEPADGQKLNRADLTVTGRAADDLALAAVTVNGQPFTVGEDGTFSGRVLLEEGSNEVVVKATDRAGNETTVTRTVSVDTVPPAIGGVEPASDVTLGPGESLTVRFTSEPDLAAASFAIVVGNATTGTAGTQPVGTPMTETAPGQYQGTYTPPAGTAFTNARVVIQALDDHGNFARAEAPGRVTVTAPAPPPSGGGGSPPPSGGGSQPPSGGGSQPPQPGPSGGGTTPPAPQQGTVVIQAGRPASLAVQGVGSVDIPAGALPSGTRVTLTPVQAGSSLHAEVERAAGFGAGVEAVIQLTAGDAAQAEAAITLRARAGAGSGLYFYDPDYKALIPVRAEFRGGELVARTTWLGTFVVARERDVRFADVGPDHWAGAHIGALARKGIAGGFPDGTFHPEQVLTREQATKMVLLAAGVRGVAGDRRFPDAAGRWSEPFLAAAAGAELLTGYPDGTVGPERPVTRAELVAMVLRALGRAPEGTPPFRDTGGHWAAGYIGRAVADGIVTGYPDGTFRPNAPVTRGEAARIIAVAFDWAR